MTAVSTSIRAYHETTNERGLMCDRLRALYSVHGPLTDREAARHLGWHPSEVSARIKCSAERLISRPDYWHF